MDALQSNASAKRCDYAWTKGGKVQPLFVAKRRTPTEVQSLLQMVFGAWWCAGAYRCKIRHFTDSINTYT